MLEKLRAYYRDALVEYGQVNERHAYEWFSTEHGELFGIKKEMLTQKERALLATLFTPYEAVTTQMNKQQQAWYRFLIHGAEHAFEQLPPSTHTRFIYFYIQKAARKCSPPHFTSCGGCSVCTSRASSIFVARWHEYT